ncbi:Endoplasmic reticulum aminopeptidase 2 [Camelus dromedarius]|uniref:Endoplasmic reticulum aminopeptidase 2 n=1 Tax=Camelus dromedarius TaxID=9838 RepID=A0A5N4ECB9_CAMDR|nr:Endoplasmic reticulum aminopeptidase 2 [Camelus dromedarius]
MSLMSYLENTLNENERAGQFALFFLVFDLGSFALRMIISGTTSHFSSKDELQEVKLFFESLKDQGIDLEIFQIVLETISKNIRWLEKNLSTLRNWLLISI